MPRCPNGYHRSPDDDCERVRDDPKTDYNSKKELDFFNDDSEESEKPEYETDEYENDFDSTKDFISEIFPQDNFNSSDYERDSDSRDRYG